MDRGLVDSKILRRHRSQGATKSHEQNGKRTQKLRGGGRPRHRTWTGNGRLAGLKHRLGRTSCLPGLPVALVREHEDLLENAGKRSSSRAGGGGGNETDAEGGLLVCLVLTLGMRDCRWNATPSAIESCKSVTRLAD